MYSASKYININSIDIKIYQYQ